MTELRVEKLTIPSVDFNGVSSLPSIGENLRLSFIRGFCKNIKYPY